MQWWSPWPRWYYCSTPSATFGTHFGATSTTSKLSALGHPITFSDPSSSAYYFLNPTLVSPSLTQPSEAQFVAPDVHTRATSTNPVSEQAGSTVLWDRCTARHETKQQREIRRCTAAVVIHQNASGICKKCLWTCEDVLIRTKMLQDYAKMFHRPGYTKMFHGPQGMLRGYPRMP